MIATIRRRRHVGRHRYGDQLVDDGERGSVGDDQVGVALGDPVRVTDYVNTIEDRIDNDPNDRRI